MRVGKHRTSRPRTLIAYTLVLFLVLGVLASWAIVGESRHPAPLQVTPMGSETPLPVEHELRPIEDGIDTVLTR